ncbi:MAG: hypothetical protein QXS81_00980 [Candidatus Micrarchaeaceae archaeon]
MKIDTNIFGGQVYEDLAKELDNRIGENSAIVRESVSSLAHELSGNIHNLAHEIAISDEGRASDRESRLPAKAPAAKLPSYYVPQASQEPLVPVLEQLKRLRA